MNRYRYYLGLHKGLWFGFGYDLHYKELNIYFLCFMLSICFTVKDGYNIFNKWIKSEKEY